MRKLLNVMAFFVISVLLVSMVSAASVSTSTLGSLIKENVMVTVNDEEVDEATLLTVEEGEKLNIEVELKMPATVKDAAGNDVLDAEGKVIPATNAEQIEVLARLSGYEYSDYVSLEDVSHVFDLKAGTKKTVDLELTVPKDISNEKNTLRVFVLDRNSNEIVQKFTFTVESARHSVEINDVYFSPGETVKAGRALLATVVLENYGEKDEEDVVVSVEVPALGIKATEVVKELTVDDRKDVPEMFLSIPATAAAGDYEVKVTAKYDKYETVTKTYTVKVVANEMFQKTDKVLLAVGPEAQSVAPGKTATYGVALSNEGTTTKAFTFDVATGGNWATASVSEMLVVLAPGQNKVVYVDVTPAADATAGDHMVSVAVKAGAETVHTLALKATVVNAAAPASAATDFNLRNGLEIALIVLVVLLVIIGLIIGFSRLRKDDEKEQTYY